ncbi:hypothetical protein AQI94_35515 [Streptomyces pseudovenezuelae]|uniref:Uncharacterized protein n=1 Tax=Streptomyces pseudovenezuelae TaxID=67350 RepID=A0A124H930_9ACTN|nr:hypothetical protein AQI94_35515 [Streptomyces pseudovenezuelae]
MRGCVEVPAVPGPYDSGVWLAGRGRAPGARFPALGAGGIGPGAGLRGGVDGDSGAGGVSGKRAEAGGGGGMLPGWGAAGPEGSWRRGAWAPGPVRGCAGAPEGSAGVEGARPEPSPSVRRVSEVP